MTLRQFKIKNKTQEIIVWLEDKVTIGDSVTLKDSSDKSVWWKIIEAYSTINSEKLKRTFDNNNYDKHVGLFNK